MMITYGHHVVDEDDPYVKLSEDVRNISNEFPGSQIVDFLPFRESSFSVMMVLF